MTLSLSQPLKRTLTLITLICVVSGAFFVGRTLGAGSQMPHVKSLLYARADVPLPSGLTALSSQEPAPNIAPSDVFEEALSNVQRNFVEINDIPLGKIDHDALARMLAALGDPKTHALSASRRKTRQSALQGKYSGLGAALAITRTRKADVDYNHLTVVAVMPGSPAEKAGLRSGDFLTEVDGRWIINYTIYADRDRIARETNKDDAARDAEAEQVSQKFRAGMSLSKALDKLESGESQTYALTVERSGLPKPLKVQIAPTLTQVDPVEYKTLGEKVKGSIGYLRVRQFNARATEAFENALDELDKLGEAGGTLKGLIVDLRQNPGGVTAEARTGVDGFTSAKKLIARLTAGGAVAGVERKPKLRELLTVAPAPTSLKLPLIVLIDGGTANLAELTATALRDGGKAKLMGAHTFGDDVLQLFAPLKSGLGVEITTAHLFTLGGIDLARGLDPDVPVTADINGSHDAALERALSALGA